MINASNEFLAAIKENTAFWVTANVVLNNGESLTLQKGDLYVSGNGIVDSSDSSDFPLGVAVEKTCTLSLVNDEDQFSEYDFSKAQFTIFLNLQLSDRIEIIRRGTFVVIKKPTTGEKINLTLADHMYKADTSYHTNLLFPATALEVLQDACTTCGIMLGDATFTNAGFIVQEAPESTTFRTVIGSVAMLAGGNARIDENDRLRILTFNHSIFANNDDIDGGVISPWTAGDDVDGGTLSPFTEGDTLDGGLLADLKDYHVLSRIKGLTIDTDEATVTGVKTTVDKVDYQYGSDGYVVTIKNPLITESEQEAVQLIGTEIIGLTMRAFSCQSIALPTATFMDPAYIVDRKGRYYRSYLTDIEFLFNGYTSVSNSIPDVLQNDSEYYSESLAAIDQAQKNAEHMLDAYDVAVQNMNQLAANTLGYYYTQETQEDGSIIVYQHDKPTLAESQIIYKRGIDGFFLSTDGGKTYNNGFDSSGNVVLNILYAIGIQAEWINTRGFSASDNEGNITFRINADDGSVDIVADSFSLRGKTVEEIAQESSKDYVDAVLPDALKEVSTQHFGAYDPTLENLPASEWITDVDRDDHLNDLFYNTDTGKTFRFIKNGDTYSWEQFEDEDIQEALEAAANAQDTADGKRRVFITTPVPPYDAGDLWWTSSEDGAALIKVCKTGRETGAFVSSDWIDNSYATGDDVNSAIDAYDTSLGQPELFNKLTNGGQTQGIFLQDGILCINADYILSGTLAGNRINAKGLYVYDNSGNTTLGIDSNGNVTIRANSFSLQGNTIQSIADSSANSAANNAYSNAVNYTNQQLANFDPSDNLTQQEVFNILTNNGSVQGIFLQGGRIYINGEFIEVNDLRAIVAKIANFTLTDTTIMSADGSLVLSSDSSPYFRLEAAGNSFTINNAASLTIRKTGSTGSTLILDPDGYYASGASGSTAQQIQTGLSRSSTVNNGNYLYATRFVGSIRVDDNATIYGDLNVSSKKNRIVDTENFGIRTLSCYEMPTPMFGDIGSGETDEDGICYIDIDPIFSESICNTTEYYVFLQKEGEGDIYVPKSEKHSTYFVVKGTPNTAFSWEIKAKQKFFETNRLEMYDDTEDPNPPITEEEALGLAIEIMNEMEAELYGY